MAAAIALQASTATAWGVLSVALAPSTTSAAIAADVSLQGNFSSSVSSYTKAMTLGANANYLLVGVVGDTTTDKVTAGSVTYNSVAMTQLIRLYAGASIGWLYLYGLASPATGSAHNIVVTATGSCSILGLEAQSYTNCSANQPNVSTSASFLSSAIAWSVLVPVGAGCWGVTFARNALGPLTSASCSGCGTTAATRVSQSGDGLASLVDTNGTIPFFTATTLTPNSSQWRLQRMDISRTTQEKLA